MNPPTTDRVLILTSYPPRVCGIATYTQDLVTALNRTFNGPFRYTVCALEDGNISRDYPDEVTHTLNTKDVDDHIRLALEVDQDPRIARVWVQHEFGLYPRWRRALPVAVPECREQARGDHLPHGAALTFSGTHRDDPRTGRAGHGCGRPHATVGADPARGVRDPGRTRSR
jgi:hypothetical protein